MKRVSDIVCQYLIANNIQVVFGIIGSANSYIYDSLMNYPEIKVVTMQHQQAAIMAINGYYRTTGKIAAAIVTAGAGASNAFTGILSCWADSIPGLVIAGQQPTHFIKMYQGMRMYGIQGFDSANVYKDYTNYSKRMDIDTVHQTMRASFQNMFIGRPALSYIQVPFDVQALMVEDEGVECLRHSQKLVNIQDIQFIIKALESSNRPLIMAGHGIKLSNSQQIFNILKERVDCPVLLTWSSKDLLTERDKHYFGMSGVHGHRYSNFIVQNCDLLLVLGSRLSLLQTGYDRTLFAPNALIIHVDIDAKETNKFNGKNINADVSTIIGKLNESNMQVNRNKQWWDYCEDMKKKYPLIQNHHNNTNNYDNSYTFIDKLCNMTPEKYTIVTDMGTALLSGFYAFKVKQGQKFFTSLGLGEMGYGLPAAIGASFGENPVLCLNCDGGMMLNLQQLQTVITYNLPIKIVIFNNDGYLMIKHTQKMLFKQRRTCVDKGTGMSLPNYKKIAQAFGYQYYTGNDVDKFMNTNNPCIYQMFMDPQQQSVPKVKGIKNNDNTITSGMLQQMSPLLQIEQIKQSMKWGVNPRSLQVIR